MTERIILDGCKSYEALLNAEDHGAILQLSSVGDVEVWIDFRENQDDTGWKLGQFLPERYRAVLRTNDSIPMPPDVDYARKMMVVADAYLKSNDPEFDVDRPFVSDKLDFCERLRAANVARDKVWNPDKKISLSFRGNELGGETGEAQNILKKLDRERLGLAGSRATVEQLAEELADIWICADLVAMEFDIRMPQAVAKKFNASSDKVGISVKLDAGESE